MLCWIYFKTLRPRQNSRHFPDDIFKCISLNENIWIPIAMSLKFVPKGPINNIPSLVQIMTWHRPGDKPLSEPMVVTLLTWIYITRPQWVKEHDNILAFSIVALFCDADGWNPSLWKTMAGLYYIQKHGCWWRGDTKAKSISTHGIDLIMLEYSDFSTRKIKYAIKWQWNHLCKVAENKQSIQN